MQAFLDEKPKKRKKEMEYEFHRDPGTGWMNMKTTNWVRIVLF